MSYAFVQDVPATWDTYREIAEALGPTAPTGLVLHAAGPTDEGFRMIGIWESREAWDRFRDERLRAILDGLVNGSRAEPTFRELEVRHLLSGGGKSLAGPL
jgi:hypothetical protein